MRDLPLLFCCILSTSCSIDMAISSHTQQKEIANAGSSFISARDCLRICHLRHALFIAYVEHRSCIGGRTLQKISPLVL
jgi:hypothetical protein